MRDQEFKRRLGMKIKLNKLLKVEGCSIKRIKLPKKAYKEKETEIAPKTVEPVEEPINKKKWTVRKNTNGQINMKNQLKYYLSKLQK